MTAYVLLNHALTEKQTSELHERYNCEKIALPPENVSELWAQIPPEQAADSFFLASVIEWLKSAERNSPVVVSGEFGMTFAVVDWCLKNNLVPLYAGTRRVAVERREGETVKKSNVFEHVCFKEYARLL